MDNILDDDEFGRDPAVRSMRRAFGHMEKLQRQIIQAASLSPFDRRLRLWREQALQIFERAWNKAARQGLARTEEEVALLYARCLAMILERGRVTLPPELLPRDESLEGIVKELLK